MKKISPILIFTLSVSIGSFAQQNTRQLPSQILTDWMQLHCKMVRSTSGIAHVEYSRHFSYTAIAVYECIVAGSPTYKSLANQLNGLNNLPQPPKEKMFWPASLNSAYANMLRKFYGNFPLCVARIDSMERAQIKKFLAQKEIDKSAEYGKAIAASILQWAATDNYISNKTYTASTTEGSWIPSGKPAAPFWQEKRTLTKDLFTAYSLKQPVYSKDPNDPFYKMANEVYTVSRNLTPEQKTIALYWDDSPNGQYMTVFGHWTSITCALIKQHDLSLMEAAEAFAKTTIAMDEAAVLAWKGKYEYNVVRPITFIHLTMDKEWTPLIATPPHPEFPAAHATLSYAAAIALCSLFGEQCSVTDNSYTDIGMNERSYSSLQDAAKEAGISRLYGGIHYRYSIDQGFNLGEAAAKHVDKTISFRK